MTLELLAVGSGADEKSQCNDWRAAQGFCLKLQRYLGIEIEHERKAEIRQLIRRMKRMRKRTW